jgi:hypothetical protein
VEVRCLPDILVSMTMTAAETMIVVIRMRGAAVVIVQLILTGS